MPLPTSRELREMLDEATSYPWQKEWGFIIASDREPGRVLADLWGAYGGVRARKEDIDLMLIAPQLAEEVIRLREEIARETIRETYTEDEEERGRRMTDKIEEILDLVKKRDHHYEGYMETCSELRNRARNRHDDVDPLEGEVWHVILASSDCARTVVPAIRGVVGWHVAPTVIKNGADDDCYITSSHVYPVERVAEAPTTKEGKE